MRTLMGCGRELAEATGRSGGWKASICLMAMVTLGGCEIAPPAFTPDEFARMVRQDREKMFVEQEAITAPITLPEAMARAVMYNMEHRLKLMEVAIAAGDSKISRYDLLPRLTETAGYTARNNDSASRSKSLATNTTDNTYSTSSERAFATANLSMAWNVLDFGVSWLRARQQADSRLVNEERRRKVVQNILQDVRFAYWRAVGAQRLLPKIDRLLVEVKKALEQSRQAEAQGLQQAQALEYQVQLLDTIRQINGIKRDLILAKAELSALMNVPPGTKFDLGSPADLVIPEVKNPLDRLQSAALFLRPEIREQRYQERISVAETTKTILRFLPGIEINIDRQYTGNSYTYNQHWIEGGLKLTWNIMNLWGADDKIALSEAKEDLVRRQQLALGVAVLTQVNVAWLRFQQAREDVTLATDLHRAASRLEEQGEKARAIAAESLLEVIRRSSRSIYMELQKDAAYAEFQNATGRLLGSVGLDLVIATDRAWNLKELTGIIDSQLTDWDQGVIALPDPNNPDAVSARPDPSDVYEREREAPAEAPRATGLDAVRNWLEQVL